MGPATKAVWLGGSGPPDRHRHRHGRHLERRAGRNGRLRLGLGTRPIWHARTRHASAASFNDRRRDELLTETLDHVRREVERLVKATGASL